MSTTFETLEATAQDALGVEWAKLVAHDAALGSAPPDGLCVLRKLLPELLRLVESCHEQQIESLRHEVRTHLLEASFNNDNGDTSCDEPELADIDRNVALMLRVLDRVRTEALARGVWSVAPATPLMCG